MAVCAETALSTNKMVSLGKGLRRNKKCDFEFENLVGMPLFKFADSE